MKGMLDHCRQALRGVSYIRAAATEGLRRRLIATLLNGRCDQDGMCVVRGPYVAVFGKFSIKICMIPGAMCRTSVCYTLVSLIT